MKTTDVEIIIQKFNINDYKIIDIYFNSFLFKSGNNTFFVNAINNKIKNTYIILKHFNINANMPINEIIHDNILYYLFRLNPKMGDINASLLSLIKDLKEIHKKLEYKIVLDDTVVSSLNNIYKVLDYRFKSIEYNIRYLESSELKGDYTWAYLSKYYIILDAKKRMLKIQEEMLKGIKERKDLSYSLCHGYPSYECYNNKQIDFFFNSYIGIISSDIAKLYILNEHIDINWNDILSKWFKEYNDSFYKNHFIFLVLYIYILNIKIDNILSYESLYSYLNIVKKIKRFLLLKI